MGYSERVVSRSGPKNSTQIYHEVSTPLRRKNDLECNSSFQTCFNNTWDPARLWLVLAFAGAPRTLSSESGSISPVRRVRRKRRGIKKAAKTSTFGKRTAFVHKVRSGFASKRERRMRAVAPRRPCQLSVGQRVPLSAPTANSKEVRSRSLSFLLFVEHARARARRRPKTIAR